MSLPLQDDWQCNPYQGQNLTFLVQLPAGLSKITILVVQ